MGNRMGMSPVPGPQPVQDRTGVSRRTVLRTAAWSTPVILAAAPAPAFAASCTTLYSGTTDWSDATYTRTSDSASSGGFTASNGVRVGITFASVFTNYAAQTSGTITNLSVVNPVGGTGGAGVTMVQAASTAAASGNSNNNQTVTVTFDHAVSNLSFLITDIDSTTNQFSDAIAITGAAFTSTVPTGSTVSGSGTTAAPFRQASNSVNADTNTGTAGNIQLNFAGPLTTFKIVYWNLLTNPSATSRIQGAWIANMTASVYNANC